MQEGKSVQLTEGIDIVTWVYPAKKRDGKTPVEFLAWDFAGQVKYIDVFVLPRDYAQCESN